MTSRVRPWRRPSPYPLPEYRERACTTLFLLMSLIVCPDVLAAPTVSVRRDSDKPIVAFQRVELDVALAKTYDNPFDPDEIAVDADITAADGRTLRLTAYWDG